MTLSDFNYRIEKEIFPAVTPHVESTPFMEARQPFGL
jgi:hypothetical protein